MTNFVLSRRALLAGASATASITAFATLVEKSAAADHVNPVISAEERRAFHLAEYKRACEELDPMIGHWSEWTDEDSGNSKICAFRVTGRYEGDGLYECAKPSPSGHKRHYQVTLRPGELIDGQRTFHVACPGERLVLLESRLETYIGRRMV